MKCFPILLLIGAVGYFMNVLFTTWLPTNYMFDPKTLNQICNSVIAKHNTTADDFSTQVLLQDIRDALASHYGDEYINKYVDEEWVFNNAGGAMGQ